MTAHGLDPANSRLALPGCKSNRMATCDGMEHNRTIMVNERGDVVDVAEAAAGVVKIAADVVKTAGAVVKTA
jgi:hypothetical protein